MWLIPQDQLVFWVGIGAEEKALFRVVSRGS
jgi:hypothetical protein